MTTVLQPCQVFFQSSQHPDAPQVMEVSINALSLKVMILCSAFNNYNIEVFHLIFLLSSRKK